MKKKRITNLIVVIALILLPFLSSANGFPYIKLSKQDAKMLTLRVSGITNNDDIVVILKDDFGQMLFSEKYSGTKEVLKRFDLKNLKSGSYSIEIENATSVKIMPLKISRQEVNIIENEFAMLFKPYIKMNENGIFDFNLLNIDGEKTTVFIIDDKGSVVFKDQIGAQVEFGKRYDISNLKKGNYDVIVDNGNRTYKKAVAN